MSTWHGSSGRGMLGSGPAGKSVMFLSAVGRLVRPCAVS